MGWEVSVKPRAKSKATITLPDMILDGYNSVPKKKEYKKLSTLSIRLSMTDTSYVHKFNKNKTL